MLEFRITEQNTIRIDHSKVVADFTKFIEFKLELPENWEGLTVNGLFYREEDETLGMVENIVSGEVRNLPSAPFKGEEFGQDFKVFISFVGTGADGQTATSSVYELTVQPSGLSGMNVTPEGDEENPFARFLRLIEEERKKAEAKAKEAAESASAAARSEKAAAGSAQSAASDAAKADQDRADAEQAVTDAEAAKEAAKASALAAAASQAAAAENEKKTDADATKTKQDRTAAEKAAGDAAAAKETAIQKAAAAEQSRLQAAESEKAATDAEEQSNVRAAAAERAAEAAQAAKKTAEEKSSAAAQSEKAAADSEAKCVEASDKVSRAEAAAVRAEQAANSIQEAVDANNAAQAAKNTATQQAQTAQLEAEKVQKIVAGNEAYTKIESDLKYSVSPRKEASSANGELKLTDADDGLSYIELQGNSEQYTNTASINLFDIEYQRSLGLDRTDKFLRTTGEIAISGNWSYSYYIKVSPSTTYSLPGLSASTAAAIVFYAKDKTYISGITTKDAVIAGLRAVTTPSNCEWIRVSYVYNSEPFKMYLGQPPSQGVVGAVDTPSPDYPSEVQSVGDIPKDINGVEIRNLFNNDAVFKSTDGQVFSYIELGDFTGNASYTMYKMPDNPMEGLFVRLSTDITKWNTDEVDVQIIANNIYSRTVGLQYSFKPPRGTKLYLKVTQTTDNTPLRIPTDEELKSLFDTMKFMVTQTTEIDEYRPYIGENNGLVKIESITRNVLNTKVTAANSGGNTDTIISENGKAVTVNQKVITSIGYAFFNFRYEPNKTYTVYCKASMKVISGSGGASIIAIRDKSMSENAIFNFFVEGLNQEVLFKFNTGDKTNLGFLVYPQTNGGTSLRALEVESPIIVEGEKTLQEMKALKYQPYHQQITWIPLREPLRAMKTAYNVFSDTVDKNGNVTKKIQKMKMSEVPNLNNGWAADPSGINARSSDIKFAYYTMDNIYKPADSNKDIPCLCEKLKYSKNGTSPTVESIWHSAVIVFQIKNIRTGLSDTEMDTIVIAKAIRDYIKASDYVVYYLLPDVNFSNYQIPAVYIETYDQETNVRCLNKVKPSDMTLDYKIAMSSLIKRLEALEEKTVQEV